MTLDEIAKLSNDELRVKVAELWGFEPGTISQVSWLGYCEPTHGETLYQLGYDVEDSAEKPNHILAKAPNFPGDLNAMHEAEGTLNTNQQIDFGCHLARLGTTYECTPGNERLFVNWGATHATARQRCIAFIATKQTIT